jgi:hypothetical protein
MARIAHIRLTNCIDTGELNPLHIAGSEFDVRHSSCVSHCEAKRHVSNLIYFFLINALEEDPGVPGQSRQRKSVFSTVLGFFPF